VFIGEEADGSVRERRPSSLMKSKIQILEHLINQLRKRKSFLSLLGQVGATHWMNQLQWSRIKKKLSYVKVSVVESLVVDLRLNRMKGSLFCLLGYYTL